jgi:acetyl-CoA synthetase
MSDIIRHSGPPHDRHADDRREPDVNWLDEAQRLDWIATPSQAGDWSFAEVDFHVRWFADGVLNVAANCIDRHLATRADQAAIIWEPDDPAEPPRRITYAQLHDEVCRFANVLKAQGVRPGDTVTI